MTHSLALALGLLDAGQPALVVLTGGGGKSSLLFALARQLPGKVILTTTTRMALDQVRTAAQTLPATLCRYPDLSVLRAASNGIFLVVGDDLADGKAGGVPPAVPSEWLPQGAATAVLVEADGARTLPVKAPGAHEPVIPTAATIVLGVAGMDALDQTIAGAAHRPALVAALLNKRQDDVLTAADLAVLLTHAQGGLKSVPQSATFVPVLNKVEDSTRLDQARAAAKEILRNDRPAKVLLTAAATKQPLHEDHGRVRAVVLAAGQSRRMGRPKQLLPWGTTTMLGQTLHLLRQTDVHDILVVTGAAAQAVSAEAAAQEVPTLHNPAYATHEMIGSLQSALRALPANIAAILVVLADQPQIEPALVDQLLAAWWQGKGRIIAPQFEGHRGNPVLIDRAHFAELLALGPDAAPRDLLHHHAVHLVDAPSAAVLQDIDDPGDYQRWRPHDA